MAAVDSMGNPAAEIIIGGDVGQKTLAVNYLDWRWVGFTSTLLRAYPALNGLYCIFSDGSSSPVNIITTEDKIKSSYSREKRVMVIGESMEAFRERYVFDLGKTVVETMDFSIELDAGIYGVTRSY